MNVNEDVMTDKDDMEQADIQFFKAQLSEELVHENNPILSNVLNLVTMEDNDILLAILTQKN